MAKRTGVPKRRIIPAQNLIQFKISLQYIKPPIWRRISVPDDHTLGDLHRLIQAVMGWSDDHAHAFQIGSVEYGRVDKQDRLSVFFAPPRKNEEIFTLRRIVDRVGQKFTYEYDFGDGWIHEILVEGSEPMPQHYQGPVCLAGERACPPEDCGGVPGYARVLRVLKKASTPDDREFRRWVGRYDPERFDLASANKWLRDFGRLEAK